MRPRYSRWGAATELSAFILVVAGSVTACMPDAAGGDAEPTVIPISFFGQDSLPMVPVTVAGRQVPFILDFGAGITVFSKELCDSIGCTSSGRMAGVRHTGEILELSLVQLPTVQLGPLARDSFIGAVLDMAAWQEVAPVAGVLSLHVLENVPFELDLSRRRLVLNPILTAEQSAGMVPGNIAVIRQHAATVELHVPVFLGHRKLGWAQLDTGTPTTTLNAVWRGDLNAYGHKLSARRTRGWTGVTDSIEYWRIEGMSAITPNMVHDSLRIGVARLVPDGVVGLDLLRRRVLTCDMRRTTCALAER